MEANFLKASRKISSDIYTSIQGMSLTQSQMITDLTYIFKIISSLQYIT